MQTAQEPSYNQVYDGFLWTLGFTNFIYFNLVNSEIVVKLFHSSFFFYSCHFFKAAIYGHTKLNVSCTKLNFNCTKYLLRIKHQINFLEPIKFIVHLKKIYATNKIIYKSTEKNKLTPILAAFEPFWWLYISLTFGIETKHYKSTSKFVQLSNNFSL